MKGVLIGGNGSIGYKHINVVKKNVYNGLKTCKLNVENLTNVRELTRAQASGA